MAKTREPFGPALEDASVGDAVDRAERDGPRRTPGSEGPESGDAPDWLTLAKNAYQDSTRFVDSSLRAQWERNERAFQSRHPPGSKYNSDAYRLRSKLYRPKTRAAIRTAEAQAAQSYFSNEDVVSIEATDDNDQRMLASARINRYLLQHRLGASNRRIGVPWFMTVIGAYQDARKYGFVCSKQWWEYKERTEEVAVPDADEDGVEALDDDGNPRMRLEERKKVIFDRPRCDLIPPENVRIDRAADWIDPIHTSPYVILIHPMYVADVERRMQRIDPKTGQPEWHHVDRTILKTAASREHWDSTRTYREGHREDSKESEIAVDEFTIIWVHENFMRWDGVDYVWYTAGTQAMLSDPEPVTEVYRHCQEGERPLVWGISIVEAHKNYPTGIPELVESLQQEANDVANLRLDNVKLAMLKRYQVRRGSQTDLRSLMRGVPGSITLVSDIERDVKEVDTRDVTSSAYAEQDRINADFDDIAGSFSTGSVQTNRRMNETVGGMQLLSGAANSIAELDLRVFTETWTEPVLQQMVRMEQAYETDLSIIALAGKKAQLYQKFGVTEIDDELLAQDLTVRVNVGIGATDPMQRVQKFAMGAEILERMFSSPIAAGLDWEEIVKEVFGPLGYRDGSRFFRKDQDPMVGMLRKQLAELQKKLDTRVIDVEGKKEVARIGGLSRIIEQYLENQGDLNREALELFNENVEHAEDRRARVREQAQRGEIDFLLEQLRQAGAERQARARDTQNSGEAGE